MSLSVVVPVFNTEQYLESCLGSLARLDIPSAEFIIVDDGSTDGSSNIIRSFVHADSRFSMITTDRVGPGEARNIGLAQAGGAFIGFLDGDDAVVPGGYTKAYDVLREGSDDFVTFGFRRVKEGLPVKTILNQGHDLDRRSVTLAECPEVVFGTILWNKIYRRDFAFQQMLPIGSTMYEDMYPTLKAFVKCASFTVSSDVGVLWTARTDNSSLTQRQGKEDNTAARVTELNRCLDLVEREGPVFLGIFLRKVLAHDVVLLLKTEKKIRSERIRQSVRDLLERVLNLSATELGVEELAGIRDEAQARVGLLTGVQAAS